LEESQQYLPKLTVYAPKQELALAVQVVKGRLLGENQTSQLIYCSREEFAVLLRLPMYEQDRQLLVQELSQLQVALQLAPSTGCHIYCVQGRSSAVEEATIVAEQWVASREAEMICAQFPVKHSNHIGFLLSANNDFIEQATSNGVIIKESQGPTISLSAKTGTVNLTIVHGDLSRIEADAIVRTALDSNSEASLAARPSIAQPTAGVSAAILLVDVPTFLPDTDPAVYSEMIDSILATAATEHYATIVIPLLGETLGWDPADTASTIVARLQAFAAKSPGYQLSVLLFGQKSSDVTAFEDAVLNAVLPTDTGLPYRPANIWSWEGDDGKWNIYEYEQLVQIERASEKGEKRVRFLGSHNGSISASKYGPAGETGAVYEINFSKDQVCQCSRPAC
jgi:hypothetical protein